MTPTEMIGGILSFSVACHHWMILRRRRREIDLLEKCYRTAYELDVRDALNRRGVDPDTGTGAEEVDFDALKKSIREELWGDEEEIVGEARHEVTCVPVWSDENVGPTFKVLGHDYEELTLEVVLTRGRRLVEILASGGHSTRNVFALEHALTRSPRKARRLWDELNLDLLDVAARLEYGPGQDGCKVPLAGGRGLGRKDAKHSDDFRSVCWFGTDHIFTATQAACVRVLWNAWQQGTPAVSQATILSAAGSLGGRLRDVFKQGQKMHPAWGTMIVDASKGAYRLAEPKQIGPFPQ